MSLENYPSFLLNFSECEMNSEEKHFYQFNSFWLDVAERQLLNDGVVVPLTPKAFDVLAALVERGGHLVEKDELLRLVWADLFVEEANVARIVHTLRKVLGEDKNGNKFIETVPKRGYRFVANVHTRETEFDNFFDSPCEKANVVTQYENKSAFENDLLAFVDHKKHFPAEEKSEKRLLLWAISAFGLIGFVMISGGFLFNFSGANSNIALNFETMKQTRLTQSGDVYIPSISPNGQYLAFINFAGAGRALHLRQIATGQVLELMPPRPKTTFWALKFSPDSNYLYYVENVENDLGVLYRIPSLGGQPQKIVDLVSGSVIVAPDGIRLAFVRIDKQDNSFINHCR